MNHEELVSKFVEFRILNSKGKLNSRSIEKISSLGLEDHIFDLTSFLPLEASLFERLFCVLNQIKEVQRCKVCHKLLKFNGRFYSTYCSIKCSVVDTNERRSQACSSSKLLKSEEENQAINKKRHRTNIDRYGEEYRKLVAEKTKKTNIERYEVETKLVLTEFQEYMRQKMEEKHGKKHALQIQKFKEKQTETCLRNYGVENPSKSVEIKVKKNLTFLKKYNMHPLSKGSPIRERGLATVKALYGVDNPFQSEEIKDRIKKRNLKMFGRESYQQLHISTESLEKLNSAEWLRTEHHENQKSLLEISRELKVSNTCVGSYLNRNGIEIRKFSTSLGESEIGSFLENNSINCIRNIRTIIAPKELDIFIPEHNVAIEYCGLYWHSDLFRDKNYHFEKWKACREKNIRLFTIFEDNWQSNRSKIEDKILYACNLLKVERVFARKCSIVELDSTQSKIFFDSNHIQGNGRGTVTYGLVYLGEIVAAMSFLKFKSSEIYEINRYATNKHVIGGFRKILSAFFKNHVCNSIFTYADLEYSVGKLYEANHFVLDKIVKPTYTYVIDGARKHRAMFRRKYLPKFLGNGFVEEQTEFENMNNNKILRVWNCGLLKYTLTREDFYGQIGV